MAACGRLQAIHILGGDDHGHMPFQRGDCPMTGVNAAARDKRTPPAIPGPDAFRVGGKGFRGGQILRGKLGPQAGLGFAKGRNTGFRRQAGAGQYEQTLTVRERVRGRVHGVC